MKKKAGCRIKVTRRTATVESGVRQDPGVVVSMKDSDNEYAEGDEFDDDELTSGQIE
jgi:hypothetical protein